MERRIERAGEWHGAEQIQHELNVGRTGAATATATVVATAMAMTMAADGAAVTVMRTIVGIVQLMMDTLKRWRCFGFDV